MFSPRRLKIVFYLASAVVLVMSLLPVSELPDISQSIWDKAQHFAGFGGLAILGAWAWPRQGWRVMLGLFAFGVAIEIAQATTGWRTGDAMDALADALGVVLGLGFVGLGQRLKLRIQKPVRV